ncbi:hypothetical protein BB560_007301, partial [Smittium megazygosporum]
MSQTTNKLYEPECFSGNNSQDPDRWIRRVELCLAKNGLLEEEYIEYIYIYLEDRAKAWFSLYKDSLKNWENFKTKFSERFYTKEQELVAWKALQTFHQDNQGIIEVAETLATLFKSAKIDSEGDKIKYFIMAVKPKYIRKLIEARVKTLLSALEIALEEEQYESIYRTENERTPQTRFTRQWNRNESTSTEKVTEAQKNTDISDLITRFNEMKVELMDVM